VAQETEFDDFGRAAGSGAYLRHPLQPREMESDPSLEDQDPFPLFLYGDDEPEPPVFERTRSERVFSSRIFKAGVLAAFAGAAVVAILALARLFGAFPSDRIPRTGASADPSPLVLVNNLPIGGAASSPEVRSAPTREEMAAAFNSVRPRPSDIRQPAAASPPPPRSTPPPRQLDPDVIAAMMKRARGLIVIGDIAAARLLLERAADAQEPSAALLLAQTYDPAVLGTPDTRSITPDPVAARNWYLRAAQLGSADAQQRLAQMKD
jgi:hypothetical protein